MVYEGQTLELFNVLSFRAKMTQREIAAKSKEIELVLENNNAHKAGSSVSTTYSVEVGAEGEILDIEILIPLDKEVVPPAGYTFKPYFLLTNALMVRLIGNPSGLQDCIKELQTYIDEHKLTPISNSYNVTVKEVKSYLEIDKSEIDIYVSVSPNVL